MADFASSLMGMAGAGAVPDALATLFTQRRQTALDQQAQANFERSMAQQDALTRLKLQEQAEAVRTRVEASRQAAADRLEAQKAATLNRMDANLNQIPTDTPLSQPTVAKYTQAGIAPERFGSVPTTVDAPPPGIAAPDQGAGPSPLPGTVANSPAPNQVQFHRMPTAVEAAQQKLLSLFPVGSRERTGAEYEVATGKNLPASMMPPPPKPGVIHDSERGLMRIGEDNSATPVLGPNGQPLAGFHQSPQPTVVITADGPQLLNKGNGTAKPIMGADGKPLAAKPSAQEQNRKDMASKVASHFDEAQSELDEAQQRGLLGPLAGRTFADFLAGKVGSTGNAADDELLGSLRLDMSALRSGFASLHGRSGANFGIAKDLEKKMDEGHMSYAELDGALKAMRKWVDTYAGGATTDAKEITVGGFKIKVQ